MKQDPAYNVTVYAKTGPSKAQPFLARVHHPRTKLHIFFEGETHEEVVASAEAFWAEYQIEREEAWARLDATREAREAKRLAKALEQA